MAVVVKMMSRDERFKKKLTLVSSCLIFQKVTLPPRCHRAIMTGKKRKSPKLWLANYAQTANNQIISLCLSYALMMQLVIYNRMFKLTWPNGKKNPLTISGTELLTRGHMFQ